ncbi:MAG: hypothetical protein QXH91_03360 [Candidatus Bathyarchaeia archaeon]
MTIRSTPRGIAFKIIPMRILVEITKGLNEELRGMNSEYRPFPRNSLIKGLSSEFSPPKGGSSKPLKT